MKQQHLTSLEMIDRLVAFDSISSRSNLPLIEFVRSYLEGYGVTARLYRSEDGNKAEMFATLGPEVAGGVVLSGHTDVVPVEGQDWTSDPFKLTHKNSRLYGRGTCDMKSFIAVALALVPEFLSRPLTRPIHFAFTSDEEVGCLGVGRLIADITASLPLPRMVIVGEPTSMKLVTAHKSCFGFVTRIRGKAAHSSQPHRGANAIVAAAKLINFLSDLAEEKRRVARPESGFDPPCTTLGIGTIDGGTALNIIPQDCRFAWEIRAVPDDDEADIVARFERYAREEVLPALQATDSTASITTEGGSAVPALRPEEDGAAERLIRELTGINHCGAVSFAAEAGLFQQAGFSTVIFGPGSIDQAHQPDEFIEIEQVKACEAFLLKLRDWAAR